MFEGEMKLKKEKCGKNATLKRAEYFSLVTISK